MTTKNILIGVVVIVLLAVGGYFLFMNNPMSSGANANANASTTAEKVEAQDISVGTGKEATPNSVVSVLYVGRLSDGTVFDSSEAHGNQALRFQLGAAGIIPGFQIGINGMKVGGERRMAIPASFGYGTADVKDPTTGKVIVPANSTLIFDVRLVNVEAAPAATSTTAK